MSLVDQDHQSQTIKVIREISMALLKHIPEFLPWRRTETGSVPTGFSYRSWLTHTFNSSHTHSKLLRLPFYQDGLKSESSVLAVQDDN